MRIILFDIDGTLLLSGGAGLEALSRAFRSRYGLRDAASGIEVHGLTDPAILRGIARSRLARDLADDEMTDLTGLYMEALPEVLAGTGSRFRVLPGAREAVEGLARREDVALGLATGNFEPAARAKLQRGGLHGYFAFGGFGSDSESRVELTRLAVERGRRAAGADAPVLLVGDTVHDVRCALAAGAECLAVATGNASEATLAAEGAHWVVPSLESSRAREVLGLDPPGDL
ncbi:MAG: HAD family hydrolase [Candidatus Eiseniibacteriota bacterium]